MLFVQGSLSHERFNFPLEVLVEDSQPNAEHLGLSMALLAVSSLQLLEQHSQRNLGVIFGNFGPF